MYERHQYKSRFVSNITCGTYEAISISKRRFRGAGVGGILGQHVFVGAHFVEENPVEAVGYIPSCVRRHIAIDVGLAAISITGGDVTNELGVRKALQLWNTALIVGIRLGRPSGTTIRIYNDVEWDGRVFCEPGKPTPIAWNQRDKMRIGVDSRVEERCPS